MHSDKYSLGGNYVKLIYVNSYYLFYKGSFPAGAHFTCTKIKQNQIENAEKIEKTKYQIKPVTYKS